MPSLTKAEEKAIIEEAVSLIKEPANWITGTWKCPIYQADEKGNILKDDNGMPIPVYDLFNRPQAQYCVEGAVNEAALKVLGSKRAGAFGVHEDDSEMTDLLGLNEIARELYPDYGGALNVNDELGGDDAEAGHKAVLKILKTKLSSLRPKRAKAVV